MHARIYSSWPERKKKTRFNINFKENFDFLTYKCVYKLRVKFCYITYI